MSTWFSSRTTLPILSNVLLRNLLRDGRLLRALEKLSGHGAGTVAFGTEGPFLQQLGMETVIFGPGAIDQAHQPDEYLDGARIAPSVDILRRVIADVCAHR